MHNRLLRSSFEPLSFLLAVVFSATTLGCTVWPFGAKERSSIITPAMRIAAIEQTATRADGTQSAAQQELTEQLALQIRTEPDPLVRRAIQEALGKFSTPLARDVIIAGLADENRDVRIACCKNLAKRPTSDSIVALRGVLERDKDFDVRMAAVDSLGRIRQPESIAALAVAVSDRDPAMQFAGVEALKRVSDQDFGNDVAAWRQYAEGGNPTVRQEISVAERLRQYSPF